MNHLRALQKIDALAALPVPADILDYARAIGGIRYWIMDSLGEQSQCAQQSARERKQLVAS